LAAVVGGNGNVSPAGFSRSRGFGNPSGIVVVTYCAFPRSDQPVTGAANGAAIAITRIHDVEDQDHRIGPGQVKRGVHAVVAGIEENGGLSIQGTGFENGPFRFHALGGVVVASGLIRPSGYLGAFRELVGLVVAVYVVAV
jgi:hypothetical protein